MAWLPRLIPTAVPTPRKHCLPRCRCASHASTASPCLLASPRRPASIPTASGHPQLAPHAAPAPARARHCLRCPAMRFNDSHCVSMLLRCQLRRRRRGMARGATPRATRPRSSRQPLRGRVLETFRLEKPKGCRPALPGPDAPNTLAVLRLSRLFPASSPPLPRPFSRRSIRPFLARFPRLLLALYRAVFCWAFCAFIRVTFLAASSWVITPRSGKQRAGSVGVFA